MSLNDLKPALLWNHFLDLTKIPRPSGSEQQVRKYLISCAKKNDFPYKEDSVGNIVIQVPGTKGYEKSATTVLQSHMDMVAEKNESSRVDPTKDPLDVYQDGDFLKARGTTLGADNGVGVAASLAVAEDKDSKHGPLELLFTVDEETALTGSFNLGKDFLKGRRLLNLDSEDFGVFFVGCAGGEDTTINLTADFTNAPKNLSGYKFKITGLKGGHSGLEIIANRANAIKLLAMTLKKISSEVEFKLSFIKGGNKRNAIPRETEAHILINKSDVEKVEKIINERHTFFKKEFSGIEEEFVFGFEPLKEYPKNVMSDEKVKTLVNLIISIPSGVIAMSRDIQGLVETSTNLGVINTNDKVVEIINCKRSSVPESLKSLRGYVWSVAELAGAEVVNAQGYPGWMPNMKSDLLKIGKAAFEGLYKKSANVTAIHAGLECGIIGEKYSGMDMISFGPDMKGVHSPDEKISISSTQKFYEFLKYFLEKLV